MANKITVDQAYSLEHEYNWSNVMLEFLIDWIKHFFNITEEDLK